MPNFVFEVEKYAYATRRPFEHAIGGKTIQCVGWLDMHGANPATQSIRYWPTTTTDMRQWPDNYKTGNVVNIIVTEEQLNTTIDMLRNERPIMARGNSDNAIGMNSSWIGTEAEYTGEGEA